MNLLAQTALVLGLISLSLGGWTLVRDWRNKVSILFAALCFCIAVWALGFVSHVTLAGRLSYDIHLFCNVLLVPLALELASRIFLRDRDRLGRPMFWLSVSGAAVLGFMIAFSLGTPGVFRTLVLFFPTLILIRYLQILGLDLWRSDSTRAGSLSVSRRVLLHAGLALTLSLCTFDHVPALGFVLPSIGNLLAALYLFFLSQLLHPRKILGLEALVSRFFAILTVSLIITGFFALLYSYFSVSFPLFLLNSFLISFAVLALWSPLLLFFRHLARSVFRTDAEARLRALEEFRLRLPGITALDELREASLEFLARQYGVAGLRFVLDSAGGSVLPEAVLRHFERLSDEKQAPVLWREPLEREREQVLIRSRRRELDRLIRFLRSNRVTIAFAVVRAEKVARTEKIEGWIGVEGFLGMHASFLLIEILHEIAGHASRILQLEATRERERLVLLGEMAAGLAHEVRNPLGAIRGAADLLDPGSGPWTKVIREEVDRLNRLVTQFLDFSRDQKETRERIDLNALVETVIGQIRPGIPGGIRLEWNPGEFPVRAEVAPDSVRQVLMNLIQNSVKALHDRSNPVVRVLTFRTGFIVSDNGTGMSEEALARAFEPFFTSFREGTGLGLSIVEKLVRFDGGRVSIRSQAGQGTEVRVEYADARPDPDH